MTAIIKVKVQRKAVVKLKVLPKFPSSVFGDAGIVITKNTGSYTISLDPVAVLAVIGLTPGVNVQAQDADLQALANNTGTGIWTVTGAGTGAVRTITGTANEVTLTNGNGVAGNPTVSLPSALTFTGKTVTGGTFATPGITGAFPLRLRSQGANAFDIGLTNTETLTANRTLTLALNNADSTVTLNGNANFFGPFAIQGSTAGLILRLTGATDVTLPTTGTLATLAGAEALTNKTVNGLTITSSTGTLTIPAAVVLTGPAASGTAMTLGNTETVTGVKTFGSAGAVGRFKLAGTTSGSTIVDATAVATGTVTIPAVTDTLIGKATTDTLTNKTFDTAGTGNSFSIAGVAVTANSGTGAVARVTSPVFVTPTLGAATATTYNGNTLTTGTFTLTGTAAKTLTFNNSLTLAGTDATTITFQGTDTYVGRATTDTLTNKSISGSTNTLSNIALSSHATQAAFTFVGNNTGGAAAPTAVDIALLTSKASPAATDLVILSDQAASGAWKKATVSSIASAGSVSSIAGNTGAFTLGIGLTNATNDIRVNLTTASNFLGSNVALNSTTFTDGPSAAQGTSGTWFASGTVTVLDTAGAQFFLAKLYDGTTVIASGSTQTNGPSQNMTISLSGFITSPAGNIRIAVKSQAAATSTMRFNDTGLSKDSGISCVRIA